MSVDARETVVQVFVVRKPPNEFQPWDFSYQESSGGSGFVIEGNRILTNAHVANYAAYIAVASPLDGRKYPARVAHVDHGSELALLEVLDPTFFARTKPATLGRTPPRQAKLVVWGFPVGGDDLASTTGIVSRVEVRRHVHSGRRLIAMQTDAMMTFGNSGGPVFCEDKVVGVAFQSRKDGPGYAIPVESIERFLRDVDDGRIDDVPDLGVFWQKIESPSLARYLQLPAPQGVLVNRVTSGGSADGHLEEGDVIVAIDGHAIAGDGSTRGEPFERIEFSFWATQRLVGESVTLDVVRRGQRLSATMVMRKPADRLPPPRYAGPRYVVYAGLVFVALTYEYVRSMKWESVNPRLRYHFWNTARDDAGLTERVVIHQVLAHDVNAGFHDVGGAVVTAINGVRLGSLADVPRALSAPRDGFHVVEIDNSGAPGDKGEFRGALVVLDAAAADAAHDEILKRYGVSRARSDLLRSE